MISILYQVNYNIEKTQWRDFMWKKENKIISSITIIIFFFCCLIKWNWWINFYSFPLNLSENWPKNTWPTLRLDLKKHGKWTWPLSGHPDGTSLGNNAFCTFNLIQGILSASFAVPLFIPAQVSQGRNYWLCDTNLCRVHFLGLWIFIDHLLRITTEEENSSGICYINHSKCYHLVSGRF